MTVRLHAADGFEFPAYVTHPKGTPKGAVVVIQEIFGVNAHIREVADGYAAQGSPCQTRRGIGLHG
jgi:carboxymethylenebutenolidase